MWHAEQVVALQLRNNQMANKDNKSVNVTQTGSPIGRQKYQRETLKGLGLNKMHKTRQLEDTPSVRGMINKVKHLVKVEEAS